MSWRRAFLAATSKCALPIGYRSLTTLPLVRERRGAPIGDLIDDQVRAALVAMASPAGGPSAPAVEDTTPRPAASPRSDERGRALNPSPDKRRGRNKARRSRPGGDGRAQRQDREAKGKHLKYPPPRGVREHQQRCGRLRDLRRAERLSPSEEQEKLDLQEYVRVWGYHPPQESSVAPAAAVAKPKKRVWYREVLVGRRN